jgi:glucans biosynthesis protein
LDVLGVSRRRVLKAAACMTAWAAAARSGWAATPPPSYAAFAAAAEALARRPYADATEQLPPPFAALDYDAYRRLRPRDERTLWLEGGRNGVLPLPRGYLFGEPVSLSVAPHGALTDTAAFVDFIDYPQASATERGALGTSGWRLLRRTGATREEAAVFQGGAYFRAVASGLAYGLSARALSINTGGAEEFPSFRAFAIAPSGDTVVVFALLDSPSLSGAYRFEIAYGDATTIDIDAALFPRTDLAAFGVAPMSSMFARGAPGTGTELHDSDGLAFRTARGEQVWRALANPSATQHSVFRDAVGGFGLQQRQRRSEAYDDSEARYEARPSLWVTPKRGWGAGALTLLEFPTVNEYHDNVVAFWTPDEPLRKAKRRDVAYRLTWDAAAPRAGDVVNTYAQAGRFEIDFAAPFSPSLTANISASAGKADAVRLAALNANTTRLSFALAPGGKAPIELRAALIGDGGRPASETWLYQWTPA